MKQQYNFLWDWLLRKGLVKATLIVNSVLLTIYLICMTILYFFLKWWAK